MPIENNTIQRITRTHEHLCNKHDTLSAIKNEASISTCTISLTDQSLQDIMIILNQYIIAYNTVHLCNICEG